MSDRLTKGIWIPLEIWEDQNLSWNEKILLMEIDSFTSVNKDCFFSNEYIAKLLKCTETSANRVLSSLIKKGYVIKTKFDGRHRFVKTAYSYNNSESKSALPQKTKQGCHKRQGRLVTNDNIINTNNKPINNYKESIEKNSLANNKNETKELSSIETNSRLQDQERKVPLKERSIPSLGEVMQYWQEKKYMSNPNMFSLYYNARNWEGIKDWKALADLWEMREKSYNKEVYEETGKQVDEEYEKYKQSLK